ncbi:MAG: alpha/beta fold hydrolase [Gammaproteobacteria bacterium]|nr:alpha/beta fold hydrolase [Gammaproteobacteria bacterium]
MADFFISYASEDRQRVAPIADFLESQGWSVWWDRRLNAGTSFDREIERELDAASCVVVVWSKFSIESDWVRAEAEEGLTRGALVPVLIDPVRPPLAFRRIQAQDISGGFNDSAKTDLVKAVSRMLDSPANPAPSPAYDSAVNHEQEIRYTRSSDRNRLAWTRTGNGPPLVRVLNWSSNLEREWSQESSRRFIDMLSSCFTYIRYNGRGGGLSETRPEFTYHFEERYRDFEAVMQACGEEKVIVFGVSEGAPTAVTWAANNPDRVTHLILLGAGNCIPIPEDRAHKLEWFYKTIEACWAKNATMPVRLMKSMFGFDLPGSEIDDHDMVKMMKDMHTAEVAAKIMQQALFSASQTDLEELAPKIQAPTLLIHSRNDVLVPPEQSQWLASLIPQAKLMLIDSKNHAAGFIGSYDELVTAEIRNFVGIT